MKKVAATSGQSVSLAALVFALGITRVGSGAGSDNVLNFYSRSSSNECSLLKNEATSQSKNTSFVLRCKKKMHRRKTFFALSYENSGNAPEFSPHGPAKQAGVSPVLHSAGLAFDSIEERPDHETWAITSRNRCDLRSPPSDVRAKTADAAPAGHR